MSYCRFPEGDVYVFLSVWGHLECCACSIESAKNGNLSSFEAFTTDSMVSHLKEHQAAGHDVPEHVFADLRHDQEENDSWILEVQSGMCPSCDTYDGNPNCKKCANKVE